MPDLPRVETAERVDRLCDEYELAFSRGENPTIEQFLMMTPAADRPQLLGTLVGLDWELRTSAGESPGLDDYRRRFPDDVAVIDAAWDELSQSSGMRPGQSSPSAAQTLAGQDADTSRDAARAAPKSFEASLKSLGRFEIIRQLGKGAFGVVYLAKDPKLDRQVALKVPQAGGFLDETDRQRFLREAKAAAGLSHPNICRVHEVSEADGCDFIVMEYVEGKPLDDYVARGKVQPKQAVQVVRKLALALEEAHRRGIVHRDIKPANVMINVRGEPIIMDFGLARVQRTADVALTQSGVIMGSPAYMSPEQARGAVDEIGPAADIYSLGIVLYELLCGKRPFNGTVMEVIGDILHIEPPPPSRHRPDLDPALEQICLMAIAKQANNRYASMKEFAAALGKYLKGSTKLVAAESNESGELANVLASMIETERGQQTSRKPLQRLAGDLEPVDAVPSLNKRNRRNSRGIIGPMGNRRTLAAVAGGLAVLLAGIYFAVILFSTPHGTVVIHVLDKNVAVTFANDEITLDSSGKKYKLKPTEKKTLKLLVDGVEIDSGTQEISVSKNEEIIITAKLLPGKQLELAIAGETKTFAVPEKNTEKAVSVTPDSSKPPLAMSVADIAPDRRAAEWVKRYGTGAVRITRTGEEVGVKAGLDLPNEPFHLTFIDLWGKKFPPEEIENFRGLKHLTKLGFHACGSVDDRGLAVLGEIPSITTLGIGRNPFTGDGLSALKGLKNLQDLSLNENPSVDDQCLRHLSAFPELSYLALGYTSITDDGLQQIKHLPKLTSVTIERTRITGAAIDHLAALPELSYLNAGYTALGDDDASKFARLKSLAELRLVGTNIGDVGVLSISEMNRLSRLNLSETRLTNDGLKSVGTMTRLRELWLVNVKGIDDAGIAHLSGLQNLGQLGLSRNNVSDACVDDLGKLKLLTVLTLHQTRITPTGLKRLQQLLPNARIEPMPEENAAGDSAAK